VRPSDKRLRDGVTLANPRTGELATPDTTVEDYRMWEAMLDDMIGPLWRTDTQNKVFRCPKCRAKYDAKEAAA
jgi:hypothetical protein